MAIRTYNFTFDVKRSIMPEPVFIRQNDSTGSTLINVHLVDNGMPVTINGDLEFRAMTADSQNVIADTTGFSNIDIYKGTFSYALPNQLSMTPGKIRIAYFMMVDASGNSSTLSFVIFVKPSADLTPSGAKNYISIIDGLIKAFNEWNETAQSSWQDFVDANKEIIKSIDPGGKVLSELIDFRHSDMLSKTFDTAKLRGDFFDNEFHSRGVSVKWFGAVGDGTTDDTKAFLDAISAAREKSAGIFVPAGSYLIDKTLILDHVVLKGAPGAKLLISADIGILLGEHGVVRDLIINSVNDVTKNILLTFGGLDANDQLITCIDAGIYNVSMSGAAATGIRLFASGTAETEGTNCVFDCRIQDVRIYNIYDGISIQAGSHSWINGNTLTGVTVRQYHHHGVSLTGTDDALSISHNFFDLQIESLGEQPEDMSDVFPLYIDLSDHNHFKLNGWDDWSGTTKASTFINLVELEIGGATAKRILKNSFTGIIEGRIAASPSDLGANEFGSLKMAETREQIFANQPTMMLTKNSDVLESIISGNMIRDFAFARETSPIATTTTSGKGIINGFVDPIGPSIDIQADDTDDVVGISVALPNQLGRAVSQGVISVSMHFGISEGKVPQYPNCWVTYYAKDRTEIKPENSNALNSFPERFADGTFGITIQYLVAESDAFVEAMNKVSYGIAFFGFNGGGHMRLYNFKICTGYATSYNDISFGSPTQLRSTNVSGTAIASFDDLGIHWNGANLNLPKFRSEWVDTKKSTDEQISTYPMNW